jgi:hypothetical protein
MRAPDKEPGDRGNPIKEPMDMEPRNMESKNMESKNMEPRNKVPLLKDSPDTSCVWHRVLRPWYSAPSLVLAKTISTPIPRLLTPGAVFLFSRDISWFSAGSLPDAGLTDRGALICLKNGVFSFLRTEEPLYGAKA